MKKNKYYFLGIGGIAMANLACLLKKRGHLISGSDLDTFGPSAVLLKKHGIKYFKNHSPLHIKKLKPDAVIIGNAIQRGNPALEYILNKQVPYCSMPEVIKEELIRGKRSIVVAGTSGKTTTAAILAWILKRAGLRPTALVGGIMKNTDSGFITGDGKHIVIEGDEYNSSFYDSLPKFLHYRPYWAIINNIQPDHLDIYGNLENIYKSFQKLVKIVPTNGLLVLNNADPFTTAITNESRSKLTTFGKNGDIWASGIKLTSDGLSFIIYNGGKRLGEIRSQLLGKHNVENILAAISVAIDIKIPFSKIRQAIADFKGVKRRLETIYYKNRITIIDDFAHNPDKVLASLSALRSHFPKHQLIAIFEPRTGSSRRKFFQSAYVPSFKPADLAYISEPYKKLALNKKEIFSSSRLVKDLNKSGVEAYAMKSADNILAHLNKSFARISKKPTIIAVMTSGEFDNIHNKLIDLVSQNVKNQTK